jgi:hypothetical protein
MSSSLQVRMVLSRSTTRRNNSSSSTCHPGAGLWLAQRRGRL